MAQTTTELCDVVKKRGPDALVAQLRGAFGLPAALASGHSIGILTATGREADEVVRHLEAVVVRQHVAGRVARHSRRVPVTVC
jgi:malonyl CoA-acyl carrier protein transacylase